VLAACEWIFGARDLAGTVSTLVRSGYDGIEIMGEPSRDLGRLQSLLEPSGLRVTGTTAHSNPREERDLAHPDRDARRHAVTYYQGCVELAARLEAPAIVLLPSAEGRHGPISTYEREWKLAVEATREVAYFAGEHGVSVAIEPLNRYETFLVNRVEQALAFADEVDVVSTGVVADLFHMNIEEDDLEKALDTAAGRLLEIHLADSNRRGLGDGHLPIDRLLGRASGAGFDGTYVVEVVGDGAELDGFVANSGAVLRSGLRRS
jgi:sugar phosphate isomerase/epimerase